MSSTNSTGGIEDFKFYEYNPTMGASILFTVLFFLISVGICFLVVQRDIKSRFKAEIWKDLQGVRNYSIGKLTGAHVPLLVGCFVELAGYIGRCVSAHDQELMGAYIEQYILLLIAPTLYAGSIYMLFGRMAHLLFAEKIMIMPARFNTAIFVCGDIASLFLQAAGGGLMANDSQHQLGCNLVTAGLFVQIGFFGLFILNEFYFYFRVFKLPSDIPRKTKTWRILNLNLLVNSFLILIRSIVRTVEFLEGFSGFIASHEWFLYVFDALPMFALPVIFVSTYHMANIYMIQEESVEIQAYNNYSHQLNGETIDEVSDELEHDYITDMEEVKL
ncbi:protein Rta1p [Monosporozyma unispora]|nr:hypothetical protein C6P44_005195 [Kazachstania unispora]